MSYVSLLEDRNGPHDDPSKLADSVDFFKNQHRFERSWGQFHVSTLCLQKDQSQDIKDSIGRNKKSWNHPLPFILEKIVLTKIHANKDVYQTTHHQYCVQPVRHLGVLVGSDGNGNWTRNGLRRPVAQELTIRAKISTDPEPTDSRNALSNNTGFLEVSAHRLTALQDISTNLSWKVVAKHPEHRKNM